MEEEAKAGTMTTGICSSNVIQIFIFTFPRPRNRHSYYEGQDRRDNFQVHEAPSANVSNANKRGSQDEYSNYRNSRGGGGGR